MSSSRQEELTALLDKVLTLPAVAALGPDPRTRRVHYDWLEAGEHTQRTVAQLSEQLRRFLDDTAWLENRRIIEILRNIEGKGVALAKSQISGDIMTSKKHGNFWIWLWSQVSRPGALVKKMRSFLLGRY